METQAHEYELLLAEDLPELLGRCCSDELEEYIREDVGTRHHLGMGDTNLTKSFQGVGIRRRAMQFPHSFEDRIHRIYQDGFATGVVAVEARRGHAHLRSDAVEGGSADPALGDET